MSLLERINQELKVALKNKEHIRVSTLRLLLSSINYARINEKKEKLTDEDIMTIIKKQAKQRKDSIEYFQKGGRDDLKEKEEAELHILESYLPQQLPDEELTQLVKDVIAETGATSRKEMGAVIKKVLEKGRGAVDGQRVRQCVSALLT